MAQVTFAELQVIDPYLDTVALLLDGSSVTSTQSLIAGTVTASGGAQVSATQSKFGGTSIALNGSSSFLKCDISRTGFNGEFTIEAWVYPLSYSTWQGIVGLSNTSSGISFYLKDGYPTFYNAGGSVVHQTRAPLNQWSHVAAVRVGNSVKTYLNGVASTGSYSFASALYTNSFVIVGASDNRPAELFNGFIDDLRISNGYARYTADFTPPTDEFSWANLPISGTVIGNRLGMLSASPPEAVLSPVVTSRNIDHRLARGDLWFSGSGFIEGTVKNTPATPVRRRVVLLDQRTSVAIREVWSDAATGAYRFEQLDLNAKFTVISYDHTGMFKGVIADNLPAEVTP